ncbi:MAG TPA: hypothetical protein VNM24_09505 [Burkholderiales bacterium]|jgi:hypothetical protein|nr:hypothetical protein [Burkholderiales bacterium]
MTLLLLPFLLRVEAAVVLDNDYVRVTRDAAPCAQAATPGCGHRIVVALGDLTLVSGAAPRRMARGDIAVFEPGESYEPPAGAFYEVAIKPGHPPVLRPPEVIAAEKNTLLYDAAEFFVFEEKLDPGDTRARHSHSQRVVIQLNRTRLQQWPDGEPEKFVDIVPERPTFSPPVIHVVKNVGAAPLRGVVIEFKPR